MAFAFCKIVILPFKQGTSRQQTLFTTLEPVLGTLINFMGLRRIWTRGIANANKFMLGAAIAYNLKKWLNYDRKKRKTAIMSLKKGLNDLNILFLTEQLTLASLNTKK